MPLPSAKQSPNLTPEISSTAAPAPMAAPPGDRVRPNGRPIRRQPRRQNFKFKFVPPSRWLVDRDFDLDWGAS